MSFLRSAKEIAVEKAERIGSLSEEEKRQLKEQEIRETGLALVEKYLMTGDVRVLREAFGRYRQVDVVPLARVVLDGLLRSLDLRSPERLEKVVAGIGNLPGGEKLASGVARLREVFLRYQAAEEEVRRQIEQEGREELHRRRIGGTAIAGINIRARVEWEQKLKGVAAPFVQELEAVRQELMVSFG